MTKEIPFNKVFLCGWSAVALLAQLGTAVAADFKGLYVGEDAAMLPQTLRGDSIYREGEQRGTWVRVSLFDGKIDSFDVIYSGRSFDRMTTIDQDVGLATAVRLHSLKPGMALPRFGYAAGRDGQVYGLCDVENRIVYVYDAVPVAPESRVERVVYLGGSAPVLDWAKLHPLENQKVVALLNAARADQTAEPRMAAVESLRAPTRDDAIRKVKEQNDAAMGKEQRTIALIRDVTTWYEVDSSHPDAVAKGQQLRDFYAG